MDPIDKTAVKVVAFFFWGYVYRCVACILAATQLLSEPCEWIIKIPVIRRLMMKFLFFSVLKRNFHVHRYPACLHDDDQINVLGLEEKILQNHKMLVPHRNAFPDRAFLRVFDSQIMFRGERCRRRTRGSAESSYLDYNRRDFSGRGVSVLRHHLEGEGLQQRWSSF